MSYRNQFASISEPLALTNGINIFNGEKMLVRKTKLNLIEYP